MLQPTRTTALALATVLFFAATAVACTDDETTTDPDAGSTSSDTGTDDTTDVGSETDSETDSDSGPTDAGTGDTDTGPPAIQTHFNRPEPGEQDRVLEDLVVDLLAEVPDDATVRAAYYTFSRTRAAEAFGDARDRGVDLELIVDNDSRHDDGSDWQAVEILRDRLGEDFFICQDDRDSGGCHGTGIQHNKFIAFSELGDGAEEVVLQSSANLTNPQLEQFNNTVVIRDDSTLYDAYVDYWYDLRSDETDLDYHRTVDGDLDTHLEFFPREYGDSVIDLLDKVDCQPDTTLHLGMAYFTDPRFDIATRLSELAEEGCDVHALVRTWAVGLLVLPQLETSDVEVLVFEDDDAVSIHSKYLLVDGRWDGDDDQQIVWTGSHNYTGPALRDNDEVLLRIRDDDVYEAFLDDWEHAAQYAEPADL